ncbi:MAG: hypothetical protein ACR2GP_07430 [Burkholderiaceae bacterium]
MDLMEMLKQYADPDPAHAATSPGHFDEVAQAAEPEAIGDGVAAAFRSDQTPPFPDMVSQLFGRSNGQQQAGVLNQLLGSLGPGLLSGVAGGVLGRMLGGGGRGNDPSTTPALTPEQASQLTPEQVRELATHAEQHDPSIVDKVGSFYGRHPQLVKSLGGIALAVILGRMARR